MLWVPNGYPKEKETGITYGLPTSISIRAVFEATKYLKEDVHPAQDNRIQVFNYGIIQVFDLLRLPDDLDQIISSR